MFEDSINILHLEGSEQNILEAEDATVKIPRTGIFICTGGWVNLTLDDSNYHVVKDCMVVYFAYSSFHITNHSNPLTGIILGADLETIQPLFYNVPDFNAIFKIKQNPLTVLSIESYGRLMHYINIFENVVNRIKEIDQRPNGHSFKNKDANDITTPTREILYQQRKLMGQCLMLEIISCFAKIGNTPRLDNRKDNVFKTFMELLYQNYRTEHEVAFYAKKLCLTCRYFSSIIKDRSGHNPSTWISLALLADAKQMLNQSSLTVHEVSEMLHFPNQSYFGKWFKTHTGISPMEFKSGKAILENKDAELAKFMPNGIFNMSTQKSDDFDL